MSTSNIFLRIFQLSVFPIVLLLGGCAAQGPVYSSAGSVPAGKALVYIYRSPSFLGGGIF